MAKVPEWVAEALPFTFVVAGVPVVKKNGKQVVRNRRTGRVLVISNQKVRSWSDEAVEAFRSQWGGLPPLPAEIELNAAIVTYCGPRQSPDASNLYEAPQDALQRAGVLANDYWIRTHNGSDRRRDVIRPRVEVTLSLFEGEKT